jgi:hypothetical protein
VLQRFIRVRVAGGWRDRRHGFVVDEAAIQRDLHPVRHESVVRGNVDNDEGTHTQGLRGERRILLPRFLRDQLAEDRVVIDADGHTSLSITVIDVGEKLVTRPEKVVAFALTGTKPGGGATAMRCGTCSSWSFSHGGTPHRNTESVSNQ